MLTMYSKQLEGIVHPKMKIQHSADGGVGEMFHSTKHFDFQG